MSRSKIPYDVTVAPQHSDLQELPAEVLHHILKFLPPNTLVDLHNTSHHFRGHVSALSNWESHFLTHFPAEYSLIQQKKINPNWSDEYQTHAAQSVYSATERTLYALIRKGDIIQHDMLVSPLSSKTTSPKSGNKTKGDRPKSDKFMLPYFQLPTDTEALFTEIPYIFYVLRDYPQQQSFDLVYGLYIQELIAKKIDKKDNAFKLLLAILCRQDEVVAKLLPDTQNNAQAPKNKHSFCWDMHLSAAIIFQNLPALKIILATLQKMTPDNTWALKHCMPGKAMDEIASFLLNDKESLIRIPDAMGLVAMQQAGFIDETVANERDNLYYHLLLQFFPEHRKLKQLEGRELNCKAYIDKRVLSLIHTAAQYGQVDFLKKLIERKGISFNLPAERLDKATPLVMACIHNQSAVASYLVKHMLIQVKNDFSQIKPIVIHALNKAINYQAYTTIYTLLDLYKQFNSQGISDKSTSSLSSLVHTRDKNEESPLIVAIKHEELKIIKTILSLTRSCKRQATSLVNFSDEKGNTPLHLAIHYKAYSVVRLLQESGADSSIKNKKGKTAFDLADKKFKTSLSLNLEKMQPNTLQDALPKLKYSDSSFFKFHSAASGSNVASSSGVTYIPSPKK